MWTGSDATWDALSVAVSAGSDVAGVGLTGEAQATRRNTSVPDKKTWNVLCMLSNLLYQRQKVSVKAIIISQLRVKGCPH
jgi:hypothetical protein